MRFTRFRRRHRRDRELSQELEAYLAAEIDERVASGASPGDARAAALRKLGNTTRVREDVYDMHTAPWMDWLARDLRHALRLLRRSPVFAVTAVLSLALGIGANAAIFQLLNAVRLETLPVSRPAELAEIVIAGGNRGHGLNSGFHSNMTYPLWEAFRREQRAFAAVFAWGTHGFMAGPRGDVRRTEGLWVSGSLFPALGVTPWRGRLLAPSDDTRGCGAAAAVIGYDYWQGAFGGTETIVGTPLVVDDRTFEIVGVTPPGFFGLEVGKRFDVALPICAAAVWDPGALDQRNLWWLVGMGRLNPGWTIEKAARQVDAISPGLFASTLPADYDPAILDTWRKFRFTAVPAGHGISAWREEYETSLWLLLATTGLVLLIACANLANLMLARASARERELAVRVAIGASRTRLVSQALAESLLIALAGGALGGWLASVLSRLLVAFVTTEANPIHLDAGADWRVVLFIVVVALATCLVSGLVPALRASSTQPATAMKAGGRGLVSRGDRLSLQRAFVVGQVALSAVLVIGAILFVRSLRNLVTMDAGFEQDAIYFSVMPLGEQARTPAESVALRQRLVERVTAIPGVAAAATSSHIPLNGMSWSFGVRVSAAGGERRGDMKFTWISDQYFRTMKVPLISGRGFDQRDRAGSPKVIIVNETFVRRLLTPGPVLGAHVRNVAEPGYPKTELEVVGVVGDTKYASLREDVPPIAFAPMAQWDKPQTWTLLAVRSASPLGALTPALKQAVGEAGIHASPRTWPLRQQVREGLMRERLLSWLSGAFGVLAALLAAIGLYGVMSYAVARRSAEIAIRMALGAASRDVLRLMLGQALWLLATGLLVGAIAALALGRAAASLLFGLTPHDLTTFVTAAVLLTAVGGAAAFIPALRAARTSPLEGLRAE